MNKKGFTLVELLAVIVILSLLALLTSTAVTKMLKDSKEDLSDTQMQLIKSAAETWGADNLMRLPNAGECGYLTLKDLKDYGLIDSNILDPKNSQKISDDLAIKISTESNSLGVPLTTYEVNPESIDGCTKIRIRLCGDIDGNNIVESADGDLLNTIITDNTWVEKDLVVYDTNGDGTVSSDDVTFISNYVEGSIESLSCPE